MENKDRLDEFLQRKFAADDPEQRFAFREEYWQQAEALIEAAERRKRRRGLFWWWWLTGGAGALLLAWALLGNGWNGFRRPAAAAPAVSVTTEGRKSQQTEAAPPAPGSESPKETAVQTANPVRRSGGSASLPAGQSSAFGVKKPVHGADVSALQPAPHSPATALETASLPATALPSSPGSEAVVPVAGQNPVETTAEDFGNLIPSTRDRNLNPVQKTGQAPAFGRVPETQTPLPVFKSREAPSDLIFLPPVSITHLHRRPAPFVAPEFAPAPAEEKMIPRRRWNWQLGVVASVSATYGDLNKKDFGPGFGLTARLALGDSPFSLNTDVLWRARRTLTDNVYDEASTDRYSFGYIRDIRIRKASATQWLEIPISLQYRRRQFGAELGLMPVQLLTLRGEERLFRQSTLQPAEVLVESRGVKLDNKNYPETGLSLFGGLEYRPVSRLGLGLRVHVQPGRPWRALEPGDVRQSPLWIDLRARLFLFQKNQKVNPR